MYFQESDVERVISSYLKIEEDNLNLFRFINELNTQVCVQKKIKISSLKRLFKYNSVLIF